MTELEHVIIGTAGHIDHGKTALVKALTGIEADTLPEEKSRGMTIELGFVFMKNPGYEKQIMFIDVPGHEKFVKTMVAGASNVDGAILVIAADEGISVQTREHLEILHLMGIRKGIIALTKSDLVDKNRIKELSSRVREFAGWTFLKDAPIIPVSSVTKDGVEEIKDNLLDLGRTVQKRGDSGLFRMPVDRVFTMRGFGTVTAGTILSGEVRVGDRLEIFPDSIAAKVRGIQVHEKITERSGIGKRTAINFQDVKKDMLRRGQCIGEPGKLFPSYRLDTKLNLLSSYEKGLKNRARVRLHVGTDERIGRVVLLDTEKLLPGETGFVQFMLEAPTVTVPGDTFVIRTFSPLVTIGGGKILDGNPKKHKRLDTETIAGQKRLDGDLQDKVEQMFIKANFGLKTSQDIAVSLGEKEESVEESAVKLEEEGKLRRIISGKTEKFIHSSAFARLEERAVNNIQEYFEKQPQRLFMPYADIRSQLQKVTDIPVFQAIMENLTAEKRIIRKDTEIALPGREVTLDKRTHDANIRIEKIYQNKGFAAPLEEDVRRQLGHSSGDFNNILKSLLERKRLIRLNKKVTYHADTIEKAKQLVEDHIRKQGSITIAALRDKLNLSRKYTQAILEYFDRTGYTVRKEDKHMLK